MQSKWIVDLKDAVVQFGKDVYADVTNVVLPGFKLLRDAAQFVADQINKLFGTDLTGGQLLITAFILGIVGAFTLFGLAFASIGTAIERGDGAQQIMPDVLAIIEPWLNGLKSGKAVAVFKDKFLAAAYVPARRQTGRRRMMPLLAFIASVAVVGAMLLH